MDDYIEDLLDQYDLFVEFPIETDDILDPEDFWDQDPGVSLEL